MKDIVEMLALAVRERDTIRWMLGFFLFPLACMFRFRDKAQESKYPSRNKPFYATVWVGNLRLVRSLPGQQCRVLGKPGVQRCSR